MQGLKRSYETVIVGGGIIGAAAAYFLARAGREVLIVERDVPAAGSSGACDGTIFIQSKPPGPKLAMGLRSARLYGELSKELKYDLGYKQQGGMILMENQEEERILGEIVEKQRAGGANVSVIDGDEARRRQPGLSQCVTSATWCPDDAHINPIYATLGLLNSALDLGCEIVKHTEATGIEQKDGAVTAVFLRDLREGSERRVGAQNVINAAGIWAPHISAMAGLHTPIVPRKGEVLITEQIEPFLTGVYLEARYIAIKHNPKLAEASGDPGLKKGVGLVIEQTEEGNILIGSSREFVGENRNATWDVIEAISRRALHFFPHLRQVSIIRSFAGLRPYTEDGLPYVGRSKKVGGFIVAAGHEGDGIALAPETGRCLAQLIIEGACDTLADFSPDRLGG